MRFSASRWFLVTLCPPPRGPEVSGAPGPYVGAARHSSFFGANVMIAAAFSMPRWLFQCSSRPISHWKASRTETPREGFSGTTFLVVGCAAADYNRYRYATVSSGLSSGAQTLRETSESRPARCQSVLSDKRTTEARALHCSVCCANNGTDHPNGMPGIVAALMRTGAIPQTRRNGSENPQRLFM